MFASHPSFRRTSHVARRLLVFSLLLSFVLPSLPLRAAGLVVDVRGLAAQEGEPDTNEPDVPAGNWEGEAEAATAPLPAYVQAGEAAGEPVDLPVENPFLPVLLEVTAERGVLSPGETLAVTVSAALAGGDAAPPVIVEVTLLLPEGLAAADGQRSLTWSGVQLSPEQPLAQARYSSNIWVTHRYYPWVSGDGNGNGRYQGMDVGGSPGGTNILTTRYTYDTYGNPVTYGSTQGGQNKPGGAFTYDDQNRVTSGYNGENFTWELRGVMSTLNGTGLGYSNTVQIHAVDTVAGVDRNDYDLAGNMTVRNKGTTWNQRMTWDSHNRLAEMSGAGVSEGYLYDASGRRIRKANLLPPNNITWYPFANYEQTGSNSSTATRYYSFGGAVVAMRTGAGAPSFLYGDGVSSTVYTTDQSGIVTSARGYYAFGGLRHSEGTMPTDRHFTGQQEDATGIYYFNARYYDPQLGQFLSPDTIVPEPSSFLSYNRYLYANGNPLKYNDPSGHCATNEDGSRSKDDADCWSYVDEIIKLWNDDPDYWNGLFKDQDNWLEYLATQSLFDKDWMFNQYETYLGSSSYIRVYNQQQAERAKLPPQKFTYGSTPCDLWDCQALGYDVMGIGGNLLTSASLAGELPSGGLTTTGIVAGTLVNQTATAAGLAHTIQGYATQQSSAADVIVISATSVANPFPVLGTISGGIQLAWDFLDPFIPFW